MPVWHQQFKDEVAAGRLAMAGILQEQHPDRALLFHQWQGMKWPLLVDGLNRLGVKVVPIHLLIDAEGVVVAVNPRPEQVRLWLKDHPARSSGIAGHRSAIETRTALGKGDAAALNRDWNSAVAAYRQAVIDHPQFGPAHFRLGVALRHRYEERGDAEDFSAAVTAWRKALDLDPNQYIWRRRIQQFGPRLDKPYPFYDWVDQARQELREKGETPHRLRTEPRGAEIAKPIRTLEAAAPSEEPDPEDRILHDTDLIRIHAVMVADTRGRRQGRLHLELHPVATKMAHWNNEAEAVTLWLQLPEGWSADRNPIRLDAPPTATSEEVRRLEVELQWPEGLPPEQALVRGYFLYNVCEGVDGTCLYRRQDLAVTLPQDPSD